jgi:histidine triad (HIT) family protein
VSDCVFCGIVAGEVPAQVVMETETIVAFRDISPAAPVHVLVVPRRHIDDAASVPPGEGALLEAMLAAARQVAVQEGIDGPDRGYRLIMNVGPDAMNSVPHLHLHVLGGRSLAGHLA